VSEQVQKLSIDEVLSKVRKLENFEVIKYEDDKIVVTPVKGIVKIGQDEELKKYLGEAKRRRPRGKPTEKQLKLLESVVKKLLEEKINFKVVFEGKEIILRFDIDHFIKVTDKEVKIAGFKNENESPIDKIYNILPPYLLARCEGCRT